MDFSPGEDKAILGCGQFARDQFDGVDAVDANRILVVRVEMRPIVLPADLDEHPNHDAIEACDLRHNAEDIKAVPGAA